MDGVALKPNDRICIGPNSIFLFKHRDRDEDASAPDTEDNPISFDFAFEEIAMADEIELDNEESSIRTEEKLEAFRIAKMEEEYAA